MKKKIVKWVIIFVSCTLGIMGCSYSAKGHSTEKIQTEGISQGTSKAQNADSDSLNHTETQVESTEKVQKKEPSQTKGVTSKDLSVKSKNMPKLSYKMKLYTKAPNKLSSVKIQYPVFFGNKAKEINKLILEKVRRLGALDPSYYTMDTKMTTKIQSAVTLQNTKIVSIVFWGTFDTNVSQFPITKIVTLNIDLQSLKLIKLTDLYKINDDFAKTFFEKAFFPTKPVTSYNKEKFPDALKEQTIEYTVPSPFSMPEYIHCFLKPDGIVLSMDAEHGSGSDHFEAELLYHDIQKYYLPKKIYWKD